MIRKILDRILHSHSAPEHFRIHSDHQSLNFFLPEKIFDACAQGNGDAWLLNQFIALQMLVEENIAEPLRNGFSIPKEEAVDFENDLRYLLQLPDPWPGRMRLNVSGQTTQRNFSLRLSLIAPDGEEIEHFQQKGPLLSLSEEETFLPSLAQWTVLSAVERHQALNPDEKSEHRNLMAIHEIQKGALMGAAVDLAHFRDLCTVAPEKVALAIKEAEEGGVNLVPVFGKGINPEAIEKRLGQIGTENSVQSLRVKNQIVILDEEKLKATQEIIRNRHIPAEQVKQFFQTPSAFLDASLVDLDTGFSLRVKGVTVFKHAYFGDTDRSGMPWFESGAENDNYRVITTEQLPKILKNLDDVRDFRQTMEDALSSGADTMAFNGAEIDLKDPASIHEKLEEIKTAILEKKSVSDPPEEDTDTWIEPVVVDIKDNDEELDYGIQIQEAVQKRLYEGEIKWSAYKRSPYPHQEQGIRWIIGLSQEDITEEQPLRGCLLADDMGLGKTYMSLVGMGEYYRLVDKQRPSLVVAPLSVLDNWKEEAEKTYAESPFKDIVILQADADLPKYRIAGAGIEIRQRDSAELFQENDVIPEKAIQYSLKVGNTHGIDRLDMPGRLILTTYQTLRDYQFSLCRVDWAFVIFDEAQNIKNPNALQTRAAKGLRAQLNLLMTGTPVENHLGDFWCLFDTARAGLLGAYQDFRKTYMTPISTAKGEHVQDVRLKIGRTLRQQVGGLMLRRLKEDHLEGLPSKRLLVGAEQKDSRFDYDPDLASTMSGLQRERYESVINRTITAKDQEEGGGSAVLKGLFQLRDVCLHPGLLDNGLLPMPASNNHAMEIISASAKLNNTISVLHRIREKDEKILLFLVNKRLQRFLKVALQKIFKVPVEIINGDTKAVAKKKSTPTRMTFIREFEARPGFGILIMSPIAAGVGLTVTGANHVIHLERHWNPAKESQATDRVYRIGQERDVYVYIPVLHHPEIPSFDVNLDRLLSRKLDLKDAVVTPEEVSSEELYESGVFGKIFASGNTPITEKDITHMPWSHFEGLVAEIALKAFGGEAMLTPLNNDKGADIVLLRNDQNILIQCKHTTQSQLNSEMPVRELHSARPFYEKQFGRKFEKLMLATNVDVGTRTLSASNLLGVEILGRKKISDYLKIFSITEQEILRRNAQPRQIFNG